MMDATCHLLWFAFLIPFAMLLWMHFEDRKIKQMIADLDLEITRLELAQAEEQAARDLLMEKQNAQ